MENSADQGSYVTDLDTDLSSWEPTRKYSLDKWLNFVALEDPDCQGLLSIYKVSPRTIIRKYIYRHDFVAGASMFSQDWDLFPDKDDEALAK